MFELALILGVIMIALSLALTFERSYMLSVFKEILDSKAHLFFGALINIMLGLLVLSVYHVISFSLIGLFALTGWLIFFRGLCLVWFPGEIVNFGRKMLKKPNTPALASIVHLVWGGLMLYLAFSLI